MYRLWLTFRSVVFWVWQIVATLIIGPFVLIVGPFSYDKGIVLAILWNKANIWGLRYICGVTWKVEGRENIPDKPCVVLSKHQSTWDAYFLPIIFAPGVYVAKRSLIWIPIFGWALYLLKFILIDRSSGRSAITQMCEQAKDRLSRGRWVLVFPEGTRRPVGAEPCYRIGGAKIAESAQADVVPVAVNAGEFWPRMGFIKWPGEITFTIGPVISHEGKTAGEILLETETWIEGRMSEITVLDRFPY
ncbi:1-acyl-sn-glycerol-3-phosphate acyltransferase [Granulosicoccus sp.]|nr:lysophospholipid acyltransferase family protein [Granulosicoccus sp.]MDB4222507.1 1-acyl-sn-glycerol-3-phosphate acyltransferase [Granulosicoccus sp.]